MAASTLKLTEENELENWQLNTNEVLQTRDGFVAKKIREAILYGYFKPGEKLDQTELAESLNVSRSPVREALRTLAAEELVKVYPHRGAVVTELSSQEIEEIHFIRGILEGTAARCAAPIIDEERLAKLQIILDTANQTSNYNRILQLNHDFHNTIYTSINHPRLLVLINSLRNIVAPYIRLYLDNSPTNREIAWAAHRRIYEACRDRDAARAEKETQEHLRQVCEGILNSMIAGSHSPDTR
jgi:DNA-binding GntR family transcriptional regulator